MIHVGCCGFPKARTAYYRHLALVEVQQTFYKPPEIETVRHWREEAPPGFTFTLKAWQLITHTPDSPTYRKAGLEIPAQAHDRYGHFRFTDEVRAAWERTCTIATTLAAPIVVLQCPARFAPTSEHIANLRAFCKWTDRRGLLLAWEPRGKWTDREIATLCRDLDLIHCTDPFVRWPVTSGTAYFRLHGIGGYRYRYSDADLAQLLEWCYLYETVYVLFNNVSMWDDALRFQGLIRR